MEEKISLTAGRDGGLQNMEIHGLVVLKISDEKQGRIKVLMANHDDKGIQLQVSLWLTVYNTGDVPRYVSGSTRFRALGRIVYGSSLVQCYERFRRKIAHL